MRWWLTWTKLSFKSNRSMVKTRSWWKELWIKRINCKKSKNKVSLAIKTHCGWSKNIIIKLVRKRTSWYTTFLGFVTQKIFATHRTNMLWTIRIGNIMTNSLSMGFSLMIVKCSTKSNRVKFMDLRFNNLAINNCSLLATSKIKMIALMKSHISPPISNPIKALIIITSKRTLHKNKFKQNIFSIIKVKFKPTKKSYTTNCVKILMRGVSKIMNLPSGKML
jgi:hypothetical protein